MRELHKLVAAPHSYLATGQLPPLPHPPLPTAEELLKVYVAFEKAKSVATYVGITNNMVRRKREWKKTSDRFVEVTWFLTRNQARAVEHVIVEANPSLRNINNSVRPAHRLFAQAAESARAFVKAKGMRAQFSAAT